MSPSRHDRNLASVALDARTQRELRTADAIHDQLLQSASAALLLLELLSSRHPAVKEDSLDVAAQVTDTVLALRGLEGQFRAPRDGAELAERLTQLGSTWTRDSTATLTVDASAVHVAARPAAAAYHAVVDIVGAIRTSRQQAHLHLRLSESSSSVDLGVSWSGQPTIADLDRDLEWIRAEIQAIGGHVAQTGRADPHARVTVSVPRHKGR